MCEVRFRIIFPKLIERSVVQQLCSIVTNLFYLTNPKYGLEAVYRRTDYK